MALALPVFSQKWNSFPLSSPNIEPSFKSSFLPPNNVKKKKNKTTIVDLPSRRRGGPLTTLITSSSSSSIKIVRCPTLDLHAAKHSKLRFVRKLKTLLLSKPRHFLPLRILSRCRSYLSLSPSHSLLSMILRYPTVFRLFHAPSFTSPSLSLLSVSLTPAAAYLAADESLLRSRIASSLASKLQKLLMLCPFSPHHPRRLLLSKLVHIAPDLGLPPNFRSRLCNAHPDRFRTVDTSYGRALELVSWDPSLATPLLPIRSPVDPNDFRLRPIIDRPPKFKQLKLRRGLNLKRRHRDYLIRFQELPEITPYSLELEPDRSAEEAEKRACAVVREVLGMTVEKRTLVDHLTHFRKEFGLPNRLRGMLIRHPEMFYVSIKGQRDSMFLVEAYNEKGKLLVEDELLSAKERLMELVREGKKMRREKRRDVSYGDEQSSDEEEDEEEEDDDGFEDLFESGIGDDWEELGGGDDDDDDDDDKLEKEIGEFWSTKAAAADGFGGGKLEAW